MHQILQLIRKAKALRMQRELDQNTVVVDISMHLFQNWIDEK